MRDQFIGGRKRPRGLPRRISDSAGRFTRQFRGTLTISVPRGIGGQPGLISHAGGGVAVFGIAEWTVCAYLNRIRRTRRQTVDRSGSPSVRDGLQRPRRRGRAVGADWSVTQ